MRRSANKLRIEVELIDASSGFSIWSQTYDRHSADVFEIQSEVAENVADKLKVALLPNAKVRVKSKPTDNIDMRILKHVNLTERFKLELSGRFVNFLNHPQYIGDRLSDVLSKGYTGTQVRNFLNPADTSFYRPDLVFSSNPRMTTIAAKITF